MANLNNRSYPKGLREIRYPSNDIIQRYTSKDYTGEIRLNNETGLFEFNPPLEGTGASSGTTFTVSQTAHGFSTGKPIYHNGVKFALANASADDTLALWIVTATPSLDTFTAAQSGRFEIESHGLITGNFYYVGETDGSLTPTEPSTYSNPVLYVESDSVIHVLPFRPSSTTSGGGGGTGSVTSVFGRDGIVIAQSGDYTKDQIGLGNVLNLEQIPVTEKASANGVATLGLDGKVPTDQLPAAVAGGIDIIGFWDANTNTPDISLLTLSQGQAYQISVAGSTTLNGISPWSEYDLAVWDNTISGNWFKLTSSGQVTSVNSKTGNVILNTDDINEGITNEYYTEAKVSANTNVSLNTAKVSADGSINTHSDVDITTIAPTNGQALTWDGSNFIPGDIVAGVSSVNSQSGIVVLDADDISDSATINKFTTQTEIDKLTGIEDGAEVNNISDINATDLTDSGDTTLHFHASDRARSSHTGTQPASTISDFQTQVSANTDVINNTAKVSANASINTHSDVDTNTTPPITGQSLVYSAGNWKPGYISGTLPSGIQGDILYHNGSTWANLPASTSGYVLMTNGIDANPSWEEPTGGVTTYLALTDTPTTRTGKKGQVLVSNDAETADVYETKGWFWNVARTFKAIFNTESLTADRTITWQDKSITPAGLDDIDVTRQRSAITVVTGNITFDFNSKNELESDTIIALSASATVTYVNDTNAEYLKYYLQVTNFVSSVLTLPDLSPQFNYVQNFEKTAARWNETARQISFLENGLYELVHSIDAAGNHFIKISDKYV